MVALYLPNIMGLFWNFFEQISGLNAGLQSEKKLNKHFFIAFDVLFFFLCIGYVILNMVLDVLFYSIAPRTPPGLPSIVAWA